MAKDEPALCTTLVETDIERILTKINLIWSQAGIAFYLESVVKEEPAPLRLDGGGIRRPSLEDLIPPGSYAEDAFNVYYVKEFDVNGIYFPKAIFVKDTASLRPVEGGIDEPLPRVTSHELGHALGLIHRQATFNLMASGTTGTTLNTEEIEIARGHAVAMERFGRAAQWLSEADALFEQGKAKGGWQIVSATHRPSAPACSAGTCEGALRTLTGQWACSAAAMQAPGDARRRQDGFLEGISSLCHSGEQRRCRQSGTGILPVKVARGDPARRSRASKTREASPGARARHLVSAPSDGPGEMGSRKKASLPSTRGLLGRKAKQPPANEWLF